VILGGGVQSSLERAMRIANRVEPQVILNRLWPKYAPGLKAMPRKPEQMAHGSLVPLPRRPPSGSGSVGVELPRRASRNGLASRAAEARQAGFALINLLSETTGIR